MKLVFNAEMLAKSVDCGNEIEFEKCDVGKSDNPKDPKFDYFKNLVMQHLTELEKKENKTVAKSFDLLEEIKKSGMAVGTVRTWNGQKFKKIAPKKWVRVYESESRGAKMAIGALRRKCAECKNSEELMQLVLANKERFVDGNGRPLGFMQEFSEYVSSLNDKHEGGAKTVVEAKSKGDSSADMKTDFDIMRRKYQSSKSIDGDEDEIYVGKETIVGKWKLVEADAPSASHDELTFHKTKGFPKAENGGTVNDRDYEHDAQAQEAVFDMAADFDGRALGFDSPIVVTQDGIVTSGNNRTMSSKLAARKGTDTKYIEALKKRARKFGFTVDDVAKFKHPRVVFETEHKGNYTTDEFAKYNESGKKAKSPIEKAVEMSKRMKTETIENIAGNISEFDTMGELYANKRATLDIFSTLISSNIIQKTDLSQYCTDGGITETGKEFLETVLVGSVISETNIRALNGAKSVRQKLVRAIVPLVENKGMKGYSINSELNEAVSIAIEVAGEKSKKNPAFRNVDDYSKLRDMFKKIDPVAVELAKKLDGRTQKEFAEFMLEMNGGLRPAANGEVDIFLGDVESKEEIVNRMLKIKDTVKKALDKFFGLFWEKA